MRPTSWKRRVRSISTSRRRAGGSRAGPATTRSASTAATPMPAAAAYLRRDRQSSSGQRPESRRGHSGRRGETARRQARGGARNVRVRSYVVERPVEQQVTCMRSASTWTPPGGPSADGRRSCGGVPGSHDRGHRHPPRRQSSARKRGSSRRSPSTRRPPIARRQFVKPFARPRSRSRTEKPGLPERPGRPGGERRGQRERVRNDDTAGSGGLGSSLANNPVDPGGGSARSTPTSAAPILERTRRTAPPAILPARWPVAASIRRSARTSAARTRAGRPDEGLQADESGADESQRPLPWVVTARRTDYRSRGLTGPTSRARPTPPGTRRRAFRRVRVSWQH